MANNVQTVAVAAVWQAVESEHRRIVSDPRSYILPDQRRPSEPSIDSSATQKFNQLLDRQSTHADHAVLYTEIERGYRYLAFTLADHANHRVAFECGYRLNCARTKCLKARWLESRTSFRPLKRWVVNQLSQWITGHMDKPLRILLTAIAVWLIYANLFFWIPEFLISPVHGSEPITPTFISALYFSTVTITTLGYGDLAPNPNIPACRIIAASEAVLGYVILGVAVAMLLRRLTIHPYSAVSQVLSSYEDAGRNALQSLTETE